MALKIPLSFYITAVYWCINSQNKIHFTSIFKNLFLAFEIKTTYLWAKGTQHRGSHRHPPSSTINLCVSHLLSPQNLTSTCQQSPGSSSTSSVLPLDLATCLVRKYLWVSALCQALFVHREQNPGTAGVPGSPRKVHSCFLVFESWFPPVGSDLFAPGMG